VNPSPHSLPLYGIKQPDVLQKIISPLKVHGDGKKTRREEKLCVDAFAFSQISCEISKALKYIFPPISDFFHCPVPLGAPYETT